MRNASSFLLLLSLGAISARAASTDSARPEIPLLSVETRLLPALDLKDPSPGFEKNAEVDIHSYELNVLLPWRRKTETSRLSATFGYESLYLDYHRWDENVDPTVADQLHAVKISVTHIKQLANPQATLRSFLTPSLNSDFKSVTTKALRLQGGVLYNRTFKGSVLSFGGVLINHYGAPRVFPAMAYQGRLSEKQSLVVRLPVLLAWSYQAAPQVEIGLAARVTGNNYRIEEEGRYHHHTVRYSLAAVGPFIKWNPRPKLSLSLDTGLVFHHDLEYYNGRDKVRDLDFKPSPLLSCGFRLLL